MRQVQKIAFHGSFEIRHNLIQIRLYWRQEERESKQV
jgi:hypothetical protein